MLKILYSMPTQGLCTHMSVLTYSIRYTRMHMYMSYAWFFLSFFSVLFLIVVHYARDCSCTCTCTCTVCVNLKRRDIPTSDRNKYIRAAPEGIHTQNILTTKASQVWNWLQVLRNGYTCIHVHVHVYIKVSAIGRLHCTPKVSGKTASLTEEGERAEGRQYNQWWIHVYACYSHTIYMYMYMHMYI